MKKQTTTTVNGKLYAVLWAKDKGGFIETEECIFCGEKHIHSPEVGHRARHCKHTSSVRFNTGWVCNEDGYVVAIERNN
jgi:hypothetical protein